MNEVYLVDHLSYSSMREFLANRYKFLQIYVLKVWGFTSSPAAIVGKAGHIALEWILTGGTVEDGIKAGLDYIEKLSDAEVRWGKTGNREQARKTYTFAINAYLAEMPAFHKVLAVEDPILTPLIMDPERAGTLDGADFEFGLPLKAVADVVEETATGEIVIHDHKFVNSYTGGQEDSPSKILQALFNYHAVRAKFGKAPARMVFHECKTSANRDGSPQRQPWTLEFDQMPEYFGAFYRLYDAVTRELGREDALFLPNLADPYDAEETLKMYAAEAVGVDRPVAVAHKTADATLAERRYVPSAADNPDNAHITEEEKVRTKLQEFGIAVEMRETHTGLNIVRYTMKPSRGIRMTDFLKHDRDIAIALKAASVRIEAPIMGTDLVGIEVPNPRRTFVTWEPGRPAQVAGALPFPLGINVYGDTIEADLAALPHLLVAGATGSGKSVFVNVLIRALMDRNTPAQLGFVLIDPKRVELAGYKGSAHLLAEPIYETDAAAKALRWLVGEMEQRYGRLESAGARNVDEYNAGVPDGMRRIVVVVDEFADLILTSAGSIETLIVRLAQKARAVGIHLVLATQRPTVDVVSGLIKANVPARVAFAVPQQNDSHVILDRSGAETLMGRGDMLFLDPGRRDLMRLQGFGL